MRYVWKELKNGCVAQKMQLVLILTVWRLSQVLCIMFVLVV